VISLHPVIKEHDDVIPQGIDAHDFYLAPDNKREIIFVGRLTPIKGIPILLKAMLALKDLDVHLTLIGDGPDKEMIENFMIQNGLVEKITLYGETDRVNEVLSKGGIFVLPSLFEGFPLSMLEAMCSGLPAIATRVGALPYFFKSGQDCIMIEPNSVTQLTQAIRLMYENDKLRNAIRLSGRERITKEFSWDIVSTKVFQVYTHAISTKTKNV
jgi:glycosyltransferase involved in cell wall biosynthesis